jgi:hypothetical protein
MSQPFNFTLSELDYWIIRRKDGESVKYVLNDQVELIPGAMPTNPSPQTQQTLNGHNLYPQPSHWTRPCQHNGDKLISRSPGDAHLYIADATGCRRGHDLYDFVLDCGDIITHLPTTRHDEDAPSGLLKGDPDLIDALDQYAEAAVPARILQIDWDDRQAPLLEPAFWPALAKLLDGHSTLCACQGGHGRSGTALTALLMCYHPEYSARDAIIHLRAMHCPRAIESVKQHEYLDAVAKHLGRKANADSTGEIQSFREAFLRLTHPSAKEFQKALKERKTA